MNFKTVMAGGRECDVVDMDGVSYVDVRGKDAVMYRPWAYVATAQGKDVRFEQGVAYKNGYGMAVPWDLVDGKMVVVYERVDKSEVNLGVRYEYPVQAQADSVVAMAEEVKKAIKVKPVHVFSGNKDAFAMGYFAVHGRVNALVGPKYLERFAEDYESWTGEEVSAHAGHGYVENHNENRQSYTLSVELPVAARALVDYLAGLDIKVYTEHGKIVVHSNKLIRGMLAQGFKIGRNDGNVESIRAMLAVDEQKAFDEGVAA